jgi:ABC-type Fe3+ transport system substrate-binding protein
VRFPKLACFATALAASTALPAFAADQALIDAAKKEGTVTWYTSAIIDQFVRPAANAFEAKYGIKVDYVRASPPEMVLRVVNEARAGRMQTDLVDGTTTAVDLRKQDLLEKWIPAYKLADRYVDPDGYWEACNEYVLTPGFNTELVPKDAIPKTWDDLLNPRWKGKMAWNSTPVASAGAGFVGLVLNDLGDEKGRAYLDKLSKQDVHGLKATGRQVLDQVIAGEYAIALQIFNNHATISKAKGAPVDWIRMSPALAVNVTMAVTKNSPHPNAGKLLFDFIMSDEGQTIMAKAGELPVAPNVKPLEPELRPEIGGFRAIYMAPDKVQASRAGWAKIYDEYFR